MLQRLGEIFLGTWEDQEAVFCQDVGIYEENTEKVEGEGGFA